MRTETFGEVGGADWHQPRPNFKPQAQHPNNSHYHQRTQPLPTDRRLHRINAMAAQIATAEALKDAKRALRACRPEDVAELRQSSATLYAWAKSLTGGPR